MTNVSLREKDEDWRHVPSAEEKEIEKVLFDMLEDYLEEVTVEQQTANSSQSTSSYVDVELFSTKVKEEYLKENPISSQQLSKKHQKHHRNKSLKKRKRDPMCSNSQESTCSSSSSEEEDLELLASIAVSASHLNTSNKIQKTTSVNGKS